MEKKSNMGLVIGLVIVIIILGVLCVLFATNTITFNNKVDNEVSEKKDSNTYSSDEKEELSNEELSDINNFFADISNSQICYIKFDDVKDVINYDNKSYLNTAVAKSTYSIVNVLEHVSIYSISYDDIYKFMSEKFNYDYDESLLKDYFKDSLKEDHYELYADGVAMVGEIADSYKIGTKYYISLTNGINEVVLNRVGSVYYFYSSTGYNN